MDELMAILQTHGVDVPALHPLVPEKNSGIWYFATAGEHALARWQTLRNVVEHTGHWPVLLGGDTSIEAHAASFGRKGAQATIATILDDAQRFDAAGWMQHELDMRYEEEPEFSVGEMVGEWPDDAPGNNQFMIPIDYKTQLPLPKSYIGLVPTSMSWQVPTYLRFGDWNYCPKPAIHSAVLRYWEQQYGAEIVGCSFDTIELRITRPPNDQPSALKLAHEQFAYCPDVVEEDTGALTEHAASLLKSGVWLFWWD